jgi:hypothetical protein
MAIEGVLLVSRPGVIGCVAAGLTSITPKRGYFGPGAVADRAAIDGEIGWAPIGEAPTDPGVGAVVLISLSVPRRAGARGNHDGAT